MNIRLRCTHSTHSFLTLTNHRLPRFFFLCESNPEVLSKGDDIRNIMHVVPRLFGASNVSVDTLGGELSVLNIVGRGGHESMELENRSRVRSCRKYLAELLNGITISLVHRMLEVVEAAQPRAEWVLNGGA